MSIRTKVKRWLFQDMPGKGVKIGTGRKSDPSTANDPGETADSTGTTDNPEQPV